MRKIQTVLRKMNTNRYCRAATPVPVPFRWQILFLWIITAELLVMFGHKIDIFVNVSTWFISLLFQRKMQTIRFMFVLFKFFISTKHIKNALRTNINTTHVWIYWAYFFYLKQSRNELQRWELMMYSVRILLANFVRLKFMVCYCHVYCCERVGRYYDSDFRHKNVRQFVVVVSSFFYYLFFMELIKFVRRKCIAPSKSKTTKWAAKNRRDPFFMSIQFRCVYNLLQRLLIQNKNTFWWKKVTFLCGYYQLLALYSYFCKHVAVSFVS